MVQGVSSVGRRLYVCGSGRGGGRFHRERVRVI